MFKYKTTFNILVLMHFFGCISSSLDMVFGMESYNSAIQEVFITTTYFIHRVVCGRIIVLCSGKKKVFP